MRIGALLLAVAILSACATSPSDYSQAAQQAATNIKAYPRGSSATPAYRPIGTVESLSCDSKTITSFTGDRGEAIQLLKLEAAKRGADVVVDYECNTRPSAFCWLSEQCSGVAASLQ